MSWFVGAAFVAGLVTAVLGTLMFVTMLQGKVHFKEPEPGKRVLDHAVPPVTDTAACAAALLLGTIWVFTIFLVPGVRPW